MSRLQRTIPGVARRVYTPEEKAAALELYATLGAAETARRTGIGAATIRSWASRTGAATVLQEEREASVRALRAQWAERRMVMVHEIGAVAHMALAQAEAAVAAGKGRDAKDFATTMAILVDKAQLLGGDATARAVQHHVRDEVIAAARTRALSLVV